MKSNLKKGKNNMTVKDLIKYLKKMPQTKEVYFFNHNNERLYKIWMREFGIFQMKKINLKLM